MASPAFDASLSETYNALCSGASLCIPEGHKLTNPAAFIQWLIDNDVTILEYANLVAVPEPARQTQGSQQTAIDYLRRRRAFEHTLQKLRATTAEIVNLYGPTETSIDATCWQATDQEKLALVPIGRPLPQLVLLFLDER
ncbi:MAG: AMP-binding protein [Pirellulaceae bacterium]